LYLIKTPSSGGKLTRKIIIKSDTFHNSYGSPLAAQGVCTYAAAWNFIHFKQNVYWNSFNKCTNDFL